MHSMHASNLGGFFADTDETCLLPTLDAQRCTTMFRFSFFAGEQGVGRKPKLVERNLNLHTFAGGTACTNEAWFRVGPAPFIEGWG